MMDMKKVYTILAAVVMTVTAVWGQNQQSDPLANGLAAVAAVSGEARTPADSVKEITPEEVPMWKKKLYYGYNFDIYFHNDSRTTHKENGWSISLQPEIGWRLRERVYLGMRIGGSYADTRSTYSYLDVNDKTYTEELRVMAGSWDVTPYVRYRLKTMFNGKVGIWLEAHLYAGMSFPRVTDGNVAGTDYDGLRYSATYGCQVLPVITYQFNRRSTFQLFFSILSLGYSGTTFCYESPTQGRYREYTNDVIIFSGKLSNLLANQFTPGLYGLKIGIQKSF